MPASPEEQNSNFYPLNSVRQLCYIWTSLHFSLESGFRKKAGVNEIQVFISSFQICHSILHALKNLEIFTSYIWSICCSCFWQEDKSGSSYFIWATGRNPRASLLHCNSWYVYVPLEHVRETLTEVYVLYPNKSRNYHSLNICCVIGISVLFLIFYINLF